MVAGEEKNDSPTFFMIFHGERCVTPYPARTASGSFLCMQPQYIEIGRRAAFMRSIFIAVSKVFGLIQVYEALLLIVGMVSIIHGLFYASFSGVADFGMTWLFGIGSVVLSFLIYLGLAWLLIFKTEWLADKLRIPEQIGIDVPPRDQLLFIGIVLVGLYISVIGLAEFGSTFLSVILKSSETFGFQVTTPPRGLLSWFFYSFLLTLLGPGLKLTLGLLFVFKVHRVISWITRNEPVSELPQAETD